jgi:DNA-binding transcriptional ArsR family regulator
MSIERQSPRTPAVVIAGERGEPAARAEAVPAAEVLVGLAAFATPAAHPAGPGRPEPRAPSARLRAALRRIGPDASEMWLHLLGIALEAPAPRDGAALLAALDATPAEELLRHVLGYHVPAWRAYVDGEVIAAAANGDMAARRILLSQPRYYAGEARTTLRRLLRLGAGQAAELLRDAVGQWYAEIVRPAEQDVRAVLERSAGRSSERLAAGPVPDAIEEITGGYRHTPEPGIDGVLLLPQLAMRPYLLLCQHRGDRVCAYPVPQRDLAVEPAHGVAAELLQVLGALDDEQRLRILAALAIGAETLQTLTDQLGLARSTVHHHLVRLRTAGLVTLTRNPDRSYSFALRRAGLAAVPDLLDRLVAAER